MTRSGAALPAVSSGAPLLDVVHHVDALTLLRALPDGSVDAVITDPPYGTNKAVWDKPVNPAIFAECIRVSRGWSLFFYSNAELHYILSAFQKLGMVAWVSVWSKTNSMERAYKYFPQWTPIVCVYKPGAAFFGQDIIECPIVPQFTPHATPKPLKLIKQLISKLTKPGNIILDPFLGSGTTAVAAIETGRHYIGCDISAEYVALAKRRLADTDPYQPTTLSTGAVQHSLFEGLAS